MFVCCGVKRSDFPAAMDVPDSQVTSPNLTHSCCAASCWSLEFMDVGRWILKRINVGDLLRKDVAKTGQAGGGPLMGCRLQKAIAEILSRREKGSCGKAKANSTAQLVGGDDSVEFGNISGRVMQSVEATVAFVCDGVARALVATSTRQPLDSFLEVGSTANRARSGTEGAHLSGCQMIFRQDESHGDSHAKGCIWMLDEEIGAEVLRRCLESPGKDCRDQNKAILRSFAEGVSCSVHSNNFAVQTPDEVGRRALVDGQVEDGSSLDGSGISWSRSCGEERRPSKEEYFLEPALVSPKGLVPQPPQESWPCGCTDTSNLDSSPSSGTAIGKPGCLGQVDPQISGEVSSAQSDDVLTASAVPTSEATHVSCYVGIVDGGIMTNPYGKFMDSARNEGKHGYKTRGEAMDPANPVFSAVASQVQVPSGEPLVGYGNIGIRIGVLQGVKALHV